MFIPILLALCALAQTPAAKKWIAVMNFEYTTGPGDGKDFADVLTAQLAADGHCKMIERKTVAKYATGELMDPRAAAKLGQVLSADGVVVGTVTESKGAEGKSAIDISARLLSTQTTEILAVVTGKGDTTALAIADVAVKLESFSDRLPAFIRKVSGLVADVKGRIVVLNVGASSGLKVGDRLLVRRAGREVKDPTTGTVIRKLEDTVGEVTVAEVDETSSVGKFTGPAPANVGDNVRNY